MQYICPVAKRLIYYLTTTTTTATARPTPTTTPTTTPTPTTTTITTTTTTTTTTATTTITFTNLMKSALVVQFTGAYISEPRIAFCSKFQLRYLILLKLE